MDVEAAPRRDAEQLGPEALRRGQGEQHVGAERAAAEAAEAAKARAAEYRPLTADEVRAAAAAEGLELVPSFTNANGFRGVRKHCGRYVAKLKEKCKERYLGNFNTPEEAALCYARYIGAERAAAEAAKARIKGRPLTADEVRAATAAEGLQLVPSSSIRVTWRAWRGPRPRSRRRTASAPATVSRRALTRSWTTSDAV